MRRIIVIISCLVAFVGATAGGCNNPGRVIKNTPGEDSRGNVTCDIVIRPDDLDSAPYTLRDQRASRCRRCPVDARWPDCNKSQDPGQRKGHAPTPATIDSTTPTAPGHTGA